jgi:Ca2+-binding EF-hand superfamily protein
MPPAMPRLGDTHVSEDSYQDLFASIDENRNGNLSLEEIKKVPMIL